MQVTLAGADMRSPEALHAQLQKRLNFPDYYGANLDALWDCLTGHINIPLTVTWLDFDVAKQHLGEYAEKVLEVFNQAQAAVPGFVIEVR